MTATSILVLNAGSATLKYAVYGPVRAASPGECLTRGQVDLAAGSREASVQLALRECDHALEPFAIAAVGHRIVHGGPALVEPQLVTGDLLATLRALVPFAPNHLPDEIQVIETTARLWPGIPQLVCFDTAFHRDLPAVARRLPIPASYDALGVRRYGFHGLSYTFLLQELRRRAGPSQADGRAILMHLGNGSSLAAVRAGRCIDTSMGFTPIGGVVMSTRSGDLDPGVVTYIARTSGFDADRLEHELSHRSGLAAISGGIGDMRELLAREASDEACRLAVAIYCYEIAKRIGAYAAALGGVDALVFSGGIGEHAPECAPGSAPPGIPRRRYRYAPQSRQLGRHLDARRASAACGRHPDRRGTRHRAPPAISFSLTERCMTIERRATLSAYRRLLARRQLPLRRPDLSARQSAAARAAALEHIKPRLLGHWGTTPGLNFIYAHLNRVITQLRPRHDLHLRPGTRRSGAGRQHLSGRHLQRGLSDGRRATRPA